MSKHVYIYGSHVKVGYWIEYSSFQEMLSTLQKPSQDILKLMDGHKWKRRKDILSSGKFPNDECNCRSCSLQQFGEWISGRSEGWNGNFCRVALMNDEVLWQWRTGSVLTYRFLDFQESRSFYEFLLEKKLGEDAGVEKEALEYQDKLKVGDWIRFKRDVVAGPCVAGNWRWSKGEIGRVYDVSPDSKMLVVSGEDGKTYLKIPKTGGSKLWISYSWIPSSEVEKLSENGSDEDLWRVLSTRSEVQSSSSSDVACKVRAFVKMVFA